MKTKKTIVAVMAAVLLGSLTACGGSSQTASSSAPAAESSAAESSENDAPAPVSAQGSDGIPADDTWQPADASLGLPTLDLGMTTDEMCRRAVLNVGNRARLANVMKRAQNKEKITFGVIGGSITQGTGAQSSQETYAFRSMAWWVKAFPDAANKLVYVNAGIGATGSYIGVHRA